MNIQSTGYGQSLAIYGARSIDTTDQVAQQPRPQEQPANTPQPAVKVTISEEARAALAEEYGREADSGGQKFESGENPVEQAG